MNTQGCKEYLFVETMFSVWTLRFDVLFVGLYRHLYRSQRGGDWTLDLHQAAKMASARYGVQLAEEPIFLTWVTGLWSVLYIP